MASAVAPGARGVTAAVLDHPGSALEVEELLLDPPGPGELRVRMLASGVCHSDLHVVDGEWGETGPLVLGHEGCGVVQQVGPGVTEPPPGRRVVLDWFASCQRCDDCRSGRPWTCRRTRSLENLLPDGSTPLHRPDGSDVRPYLGIATFGAEAVVPARAAVPVPEEVPPEVAALIGCCVTTGVSAVLRAARPRAGDPAVVFGLGGVGLSVVMGLTLVGASPVVAVDRVASKLALAEELGATATIAAESSAATVDAVLEATGGGAAFAFEAIGLAATIEETIGSLRAGGTAVLVGMTPFGVAASFDAFDLVDRSLRIVGTNYGFGIPAVDFPLYARLYLQGRLPVDLLIEERIALSDVNRALDAMRRGDGARRMILHGLLGDPPGP
jgi:S-(hydroxymethyl)glutathione dehydrogenase/alcohol dehydrogenase